MEKVAYYLNENYEKCLGNNTIIEKPYSIWDELFLWIEEANTSLRTSRTFSDSFLNYIKSFRKDIPEIIAKGNALPWWGSYQNFDLAKKINSKEYSYLLGKELNLGINNSEICLGSEIEFRHDYICKNIYSFSGIDTVVLKNEDDLTRIKENISYLCEPYLPKISEFGHTIFPNNEKFTYENIVDRRSQYKGTLIYESDELIELEKRLVPAIQKIRDDGWSDIIQIDSLKYKKGSHEDFYYLMEINARKSMGLMANLLKKALDFESPCNALFIVNKKKFEKNNFLEIQNALEQELWSVGKEEGIVITSDFTQPFVHFFLGAENKKKIQYLFHRAWKKISKEPLPIEFIIEL